MENAAKALIIAGGVLIAMLILSIGVYLIRAFGEVSDSYITQLDATELQKYNSNFEVFVGRDDIVAQEIITLVNIAQQKEQEINIYLVMRSGEENITNYDEKQKNDFLSKHILTYKINETGEEERKNLFEYVSIGYGTDGRVNEIKFKKNN